MGSYNNFKNLDGTSQPEGNFLLTRQSSVYSLSFDELQNTFGGVGKDFGSMNMDELLKNIWTAEGAQPMASPSAVPSGNLQKQGSLTLPRTLSQKTVDQVWRELFKESENLKDGSGNGGANFPSRQATLGEITLEEFLLRAGVVGEATQPIARPNNGGFFGEISQENNANGDFTFGFIQPPRNHESSSNATTENNKNAARKWKPTSAFPSPLSLGNNIMQTSEGTKGPIVGRADTSTNNSLVQNRVVQSGAMGMASLAPRPTIIAAGSPKNQMTSNMIARSGLNITSLSPSPYAVNEGARGRRAGGILEKVVERRQKRMIKNRESAARSRARKQAYTLELEAEIAELKEVNEDLQKKQEELIEMQKNEILEKMKLPRGSKRACLRRTLTGPW